MAGVQRSFAAWIASDSSRTMNKTLLKPENDLKLYKRAERGNSMTCLNNNSKPDGSMSRNCVLFSRQPFLGALRL